MFGHRSFLLTGGTSESEIRALIGGGMELLSYNLSLERALDDKGKPQTEIFGGSVTATLSRIPPDDIIFWGLRPRVYKSGAILTVNEENQVIDRLIFKNAACIGMQINYMQRGQGYTSTRLLIQAEEIKLGRLSSATYKNKWVR